MSGTKDSNWTSFVGPQDNGRTVFSGWTAPTDPQNYDDLVKGSNVIGLTVRDLAIPAAREDSIDFVRGSDYLVSRCAIHGSVTIKGSIDGWRIQNCQVSGTIEVGQYDNYWFPGRKPTRNGHLANLSSPDGKPVRLKLWDADMPSVVNANVKVTKIPKLVWYPYFLFRYLCQKS